MNQYAPVVRDFIVQNFLFSDAGFELGDDESFLRKGIIDSTGVMEVVAWLEETFGFSVQDADLVPENFDSVNNIGNYISRRIVS